MTDVKQLISDLVVAGVDPELVGRVAAALCEREPVIVEKGRSTAAERQARYRDRQKASQSVTDRNEVTPSPSDKKLPPHPPEKLTPSPKENPPTGVKRKGSAVTATPRSELETVLDAEHAGAVLDHRQRMRLPLTAHGAKLLAGKLAQAPDPNAAADAMILHGWRGFEVSWLERKQALGGTGPPRRTAKDDMLSALDELIPDHPGPDR